jgi:hypothetical protein
MASCFRDVIFTNSNFFPILFNVGQPQTGKSTCARSLASIFTADQPPFNLSTGTVVGFQRKLARNRNCIAWLDEYRNDIDVKRFQALKGGFDGAGAEKGIMSNDNRTKVSKINSGYIISGQHYPTIDENALLTRVILLEFMRKLDELSNDDIKEYEELSKWELTGLSNLILEVVAYRDYFQDNWRQFYQETYKELTIKISFNNYEGRIMQSFCCLLTTLRLLNDKLNLHYNYQSIFELGCEYIQNQSAISSETNVLSSFWKMLEFLSFDGLLKNDEDYKVISCSSIKVRGKGDKDEVLTFAKNKNVLFLRFQRVFPKYSEHHRKQTGENGHAETSLKSYMKSDKKAFIGNVKAVDFGSGQTSAYAFDYDALMLVLKDVQVGSFSPNIESEFYTKAEKSEQEQSPF